MNKILRDQNGQSPASRWRRQPIYATTRLRCAMAMMVLALAVVLSALPSFATHVECQVVTSTNALLAAPVCVENAQRD